jgi:hypothetical protein
MHLIGADAVVPCLDGRPRRYVNLDYAASTPVMAAVWDAVEALVLGTAACIAAAG